MGKTMTLKYFQELVQKQDFVKSILEEFPYEVGKDIFEKVAVGFSFTEDFVRKTAYKCCKCGKTMLYDNQGVLYDVNCPECGEKKFVLPYRNERKATFLQPKPFCKKMDGAFIIGMIDVHIRGNDSLEVVFEKDGENDWMMKDLSSYTKLSQIGIFLEKYGFRRYNMYGGNFADVGYFSNNSMNCSLPEGDDFKEFLGIWKNKLTEAGMYRDGMESDNKPLSSFFDLYKEALDIVSKKNQKPSAKKIKTKENSLKQFPVELAKKYFSVDKDTYLSMQMGVNGKTIQQAFLCSCGEVIIGTTHNDGYYQLAPTVFECPKCKKTTSFLPNNWRERTIDFLYWEKLSEDEIVIRRASVHGKIVSGSEANFTTCEQQRVYLTKKRWEVYKDNEGIWTKATKASLFKKSDYAKLFCLNTKEEMEDIINSTFLKYSGVYQAWGLKDFESFGMEDYGIFLKDSYLARWYELPSIELLAKAGIPQITKAACIGDVNNNYFDINFSASNIYDMLAITKNTFKIVRASNADIGEMHLIDALCRAFPEFDSSMWDIVKKENISHTFYVTCRDTQTPPKKMLDYLESCYNNQCIVKAEAINIFNDYYRMAKTIGFNLEDKHIKFPSSLKKEHDKASFAYKVIEDKIKMEEFIKNTKECESKYSFKGKEYMVVFPKTPDEVVFEGQALNHCVASYVTLIEEGKTSVCFLRKVNAPKTPFFTCEISGDILRQVKGRFNQYPREDGLLEFIHKWAEKKGLKEVFMSH